jgi:dCTP deaminase
MFLGDASLNHLLKDAIKPFKAEHVKDASYMLTLGGEYYQTAGPDAPKVVSKIQEGQQIEIKPGQFAFLITEETVYVDPHHLAFISMKAGIKFNGLVNISGFHVDPGYEGKLIFSVFNAGSTTVTLKRGESIFLIWFAQLDQKNKSYGKGYNSIPSKLITGINGDVASNPVLKSKIEILEEKVRDYGTRLGNLDNYFRWSFGILFSAMVAVLISFAFKFGTSSPSDRQGSSSESHNKPINLDSLVEAKVRLILSKEDTKPPLPTQP